MFEMLPLPRSWPVFVSWAEANAYARWRGARLPSEGEYQRAAYGSDGGADRRFPWGDAPPDIRRGVFDFSSWDPEPAGSHPAGRSAWGVDDLVGNGWEWTSTVFAPFPGFRPLPSYPEYSADFFDGEHVVLKGASPATARDLLRPSFRNWFRPRYPHVYATFRCARTADA
jgi:iron(II)-dependent oxidoreductase